MKIVLQLMFHSISPKLFPPNQTKQLSLVPLVQCYIKFNPTVSLGPTRQYFQDGCIFTAGLWKWVDRLRMRDGLVTVHDDRMTDIPLDGTVEGFYVIVSTRR